MPTVTQRRIEFSEAASVEEDGEHIQAQQFDVLKGPVIVREKLPRWLPSSVLLGFLRDARLRLAEPIAVAIGQEEGQIVAEADEFGEFGWGSNVSEALTDLQRAVAELYFALEVDQERLGPDLQTTWQRLRAKIRKV